MIFLIKKDLWQHNKFMAKEKVVIRDCYENRNNKNVWWKKYEEHKNYEKNMRKEELWQNKNCEGKQIMSKIWAYLPIDS